MIVSSLIVSLVVCLLVSFILRNYKSHRESGGAFSLLCLLLLMGLSQTSSMAILSGAIAFGVGMICRERSVLGWRLTAVCCMMVPLSAVIVSLFGWSYVQSLTTLQAKFPFESLNDRLGYESAGIAKAQGSDQEPATHTLSPESADLIRQVDGYSDELSDWRIYKLQVLHQSQFEAFSNSPGFGPLRGYRPISEEILRNEARPAILPPAAPETPRAIAR